MFMTLGKIVRPHNIRGELRMHLYTAFPERILHLETVYLNQKRDPETATAYQLKQARLHRGAALLLLEGINDRTQAEALRGQLVMVPIAEGAPLEEGEMYVAQLMGLSVQTEEGEFLGKVEAIIETGANDVLLLRGTARGDVLIPDIEEVVRNVDLEAGVITIRPLPGLLD